MRPGVRVSWLDGRSREGRLAKRTRAQLIAEKGGDVTPAEMLLIDQVVALHVRLRVMGEAFVRTGEIGPDGGETYARTVAALGDTLERIGLSSRVFAQVGRAA